MLNQCSPVPRARISTAGKDVVNTDLCHMQAYEGSRLHNLIYSARVNILIASPEKLTLSTKAIKGAFTNDVI